MRRRGSVLGAAGLAVATWLSLGVASVSAADPTFGVPTIESTFGEGVSVSQPVTLDAAPYRVELLFTTGVDGVPLVIEVDPPARGGATTLETTVDEGHIYPNTPIEARWRITPEQGGPSVTGPVAAIVYEDDRFEWQTVEGDIVRVHWYEGSQAFGERALAIGEQAVVETSELLGVTEEEPVDFYIYADQDAFYDALGPGTRENVGGQANADIRTLFALIGPSEIDDPWVGIVVPHELVHLVFDTAVSNPYHFPPRWLNEGLATYLSQGYDAGDRSQVEGAADDGELIPLDGLTGQFPTGDGFFLAYAESVSAVDHLMRTHGEDALVELISSYADGRTDDEAFQAAIGMDVAAFDAAWQAELGAAPPVRNGPQPAPAGPQPAGWGVAPASPAVPGATAGPGEATAAASEAARPPTGAPTEPSGGAVAIGIIAGLLGLAAVGLIALRARRPTGSPT
jgi:hypothetical protein